MSKPNSNQNSNQKGSIIVFTVLMVGSILAVALTLTAIFLPKIRAVVNAGEGSVGAIYAADSIIEWCIYMNRGNPVRPQPVMANGATYTLVPADCTVIPTTNQAVGTYQGVSRSLQFQNL